MYKKVLESALQRERFLNSLKLGKVSEILDALILFPVGLFSFFAFQIDYTVPTIIAEEMSYM